MVCRFCGSVDDWSLSVGFTVRVAAAQPVRPGDELRVRIAGFDRILVVKEPISKRVGAVPAAAAVEDKTPPPLPREERAFVPMRDRGAGRPTKRERRDIDKLRGRDADGETDR